MLINAFMNLFIKGIKIIVFVVRVMDYYITKRTIHFKYQNIVHINSRR